jgi:23S rRNA pseudouridine2605 synthase
MVQDTAERLQKALARLGLASRREAEDWIRAGRLTVNGTVASLGMKVRASDQIRLDGRLVRQRPPAHTHVFLYHRSPGESLREPRESGGDDANEFAGADPETASNRAAEGMRVPHGKAPRGDNTAYHAPLRERLPKRAGRRFISISPMPNIDGGLELLSSDGELAEKLQRTVRRLDSEFSVRIHGELSDAQRKQIREGVLDRGVLTVQALESSGGEATNRWYTIQARGASGKDIRQLFERQGATVSRVLRTKLGTIELGRQLGRGQFRKLTDAELSSLTGAASGGEASMETAAQREPRTFVRAPTRPRKKSVRAHAKKSTGRRRS